MSLWRRQLRRQRRRASQLGHARWDPRARTRRHAQPIASHQRFRQREVPRPRPHERIAHREFRAHMSARFGQARRQTPCARLARVHQRARVALVGLGASRAIGVHRRVVRVGHDHLVAQRFEVAGHPLAFRARLEQNTRSRSLTEHRGEPLTARRDSAVGDGAVVRLDGPLSLALVQIQGDDLHAG